MRIRTIKPEFWGNPLMGKQSDCTQLLAIGLLNLADDEGYFFADPKLVRNALRPFDDDSRITTVSLRELSLIGYISIVKHKTHGDIGKVEKFLNHQVINKPKSSIIKTLYNSGTNTVLIPSSDGLEGKGTGKGTEGIPPNPQGGMDGDELFPDSQPKARFLPSNWRKISERDRKRTKVLRNTETMNIIGSWFQRRPDTLWTIAEAVALMSLNPSLQEIEGMGKYYTAIIASDDYRRHDVQTLLNNWSGELDRARKFVTTQSA
jgi:hypothetical protein